MVDLCLFYPEYRLMKTLPIKFSKKGFKHLQLQREGDVALYKRSSIEFPKSVHYEVVIISSHDGISINGNFIEAGELYPSSSQWGDKGWTYTSLELAEAGFSKALKRHKASLKRKADEAAKKAIKK